MINLEKIDNRKILLSKEIKKNGIENLKFNVKMALDKSGSMIPLYKTNKIQDLLERLIPISLSFDSDGKLELYFFDDSYLKKEEIQLSNLDNFIKKRFNDLTFGGTNYAPVIYKIISDSYPIKNKIIKKFKQISNGIFGLFGSKQIEHEEIEPYFENDKSKIPNLVLFITDGDNFDKKETENLIKKISGLNTFFIFIGIGDTGNKNFSFLEKLDNLQDRIVDNADFINIKNFENISDEDLYKLILKAIPAWINECKSKDII